MQRSLLPPITPRFFTPIVFGTLGACAAIGDREVEWQGTREQLAGVEVVRNPATPMLDSGAARAERLWRSGPREGSAPPDSLWQNAASLALVGDDVFVLDRMAARVYQLRARDGGQIATWGRKGRGPGELARPASVFSLGEHVAILDGGKGTIERFTPAGGWLDPVRLSSVTFTAFPLDGTRSVAASMRGTEILRVSGEPTVLELQDAVALPEGHAHGCRRLGHLEDAIVRVSCILPHVQILDTLGRGVGEILLGLEPLQTADSTLDRFTQDVRRTMGSVNAGIPSAELERQAPGSRRFPSTRVGPTSRCAMESPTRWIGIPTPTWRSSSRIASTWTEQNATANGLLDTAARRSGPSVNPPGSAM